MRRPLVLAALVLSACSGRPPEAGGGGALLDLWGAVAVGTEALAAADVPAVCDAPFGTWFADFGVRGLACSADQVVRLGDAARRGPTPVWTSGPHRLGADGPSLDLKAARDFGHYDPAFVAWAVENAVPRTEAAVRLAQPVYDRHVRRLARIYWLAYRDLAAGGFPHALPPGGPSDYAAYLDGGPLPEAARFEGGASVFLLFGDRSEHVAARLVAPADNVWELRYEANTAYGFWIRRRADGTEAAFRTGLEEVLRAFDADWVGAEGA